MRALIFLFLIPSFIFSQDFKIASASSWVKNVQVEYDQEVYSSGGSISYLLLDYQDNIDREEEFVHVVYQVLNDEGVQNYSNISVDFDPSYQALTFHEISIIREGKKIDKLNLSDFTTIRRESDMNRFLYDESLTSYINLTDIRSNDIVEYSYSRKGFNPIFQGHYSSSFYQDFSVPVDAISIRILSSKTLHFKSLNNAINPKKNGSEYSVEINPELIIYEDNTPNWYIPYRVLYVSTFDGWSEIVDWARPLYAIEKDEIEELLEKYNDEHNVENSKVDEIISAIRFVQDEIRYLGFESGIKGYKPTRPGVVLERRFGDCKDKSNLLVGLLTGLGVEAYPMLVHSSKEHMINEEQPSPTSFDHCVVQFSFEENEYFVDPTFNNQGGGLEMLQFPNYRWGLLVKEGETQLKDLGETSFYKQKIKETILVKDLLVGGQAELEIESRYFGASADYIRNYFDNSNVAQITNEYKSFYSSLYSDITSQEDVRIVDNNRDNRNEVIVYEKYLIENFWSESDAGGIIAEAYPLVIEGLLSPKVPSQRSMPYSLSQPIDVTEEITLVMPEDWNVSDSETSVSGEGFDYSSEASGSGNEVKILFSYKSDKPFIESYQASDFLQKREEIMNDLSFNVTYNSEIGNGSNMNYPVLLLSIFILIISVWLAYRIYFHYDPHNEVFGQELTIGGWLSLLAIGLVITPIRIIIGISELLSYWENSTWQGLKFSYSQGTYLALSSLIISEVIFNIMFLVFSALIAILFFKRRTSAPNLISIFLVSNLAFVALDAFLVGVILEDDTFGKSIAEIARSGIFTILWTLYLNMSDRAKNTFVNTAKLE